MQSALPLIFGEAKTERINTPFKMPPYLYWGRSVVWRNAGFIQLFDKEMKSWI
jgi:hypothetical protein